MVQKYIILTDRATDFNGKILHLDFQGLDPISPQSDDDRTFVSWIRVFSKSRLTILIVVINLYFDISAIALFPVRQLTND
jgi:hypothetical protein